MTRIGGTRKSASSTRASSRGSSASTVPIPARIAPACARSRCTSARAASPVIHRLSPAAVAVRPSRVAASLQRTQGRPRSNRDTKPRLSSRACASSSPVATSTPAAVSSAKPIPATLGSGSRIAATTLATPRIDESPGARSGASGVAAGFQRHVGGGSGGMAARGGERVDLGVRLTRVPVPSFTGDSLPVRDHAADPGIGIGGIEAAPGERERAHHVAAVDSAAVHDAIAPAISHQGSGGSGCAAPPAAARSPGVRPRHGTRSRPRTCGRRRRSGRRRPGRGRATRP